MAVAVTARAQYAVDFFVSKGWTKEQAAGIVGNLMQESGPNLKITASGDGGQAYGIAQWHPDRQADFATFSGKSITDNSVTLNDQLEFVNYELTQGKEKSAGNKIRATSTAADAAAATDRYYERSNGLSTSNRVANAQALSDASPSNQTPNATTPEEMNNLGNVEIFHGPAVVNQGTEPGPGGYVDPVVDPSTGQPNVAAGTGGVYGVTDIDLSSPLPNVLHGFPSYTYGLSLHLLSADEYNGLTTGTIVNYSPVRVLVASAGRWNDNNVSPAQGGNPFERSPYFAQDFYFENLTMTTVIGTNATSRNTNAIEFSFTLVEPYGMTLINRLLDQANDPEVNAQNYLDMVYLLQIDFFATTDAGLIVGTIPDTTKRFPIKITQMNITASGSGSKYEIIAVPYNHLAYEQTAISVPANFEISASTVGEFFSGGGTQNVSFSGALNGWNGDLANNNKIGVPDTYNFAIDPSIANSNFTDTSTISPRDTAMGNPTNSGSIRLGNLGAGIAGAAAGLSNNYNPSAKNFSINAGTSIDKVIDYVMRSSNYVKNQVTIPDGVDPQTYINQQAQFANQPLNWYKTTSTVTIGNYDPVRKTYAKNYTYNVQPYVIYNVKNDVAPQGKVKDFVKEYNYIYTGKNDDVISFDLNFNTLYYTAQTAYRGAVSKIYKSADSTANNNADQNPATYQGANQDPNNVMPLIMQPQVYNYKSRATGGATDAKAVAVADLEDSLMTLSAADMLSVNLNILGDPQFIKQDDVFYSPSNTTNFNVLDPRLTPNGSLRTDYREVYVRLTFRTPIDLDEPTGMMYFGQSYQTSVFSGIYKVLTVSSEFNRGVFQQTLNLIRLPNQPQYDHSTRRISSVNTERNADPASATDLQMMPTVNNVPIPTTDSVPDEAVGQISAQAQLGQEIIPPILTSQTQDLRSIDQTASETAITSADVPAVAPNFTPISVAGNQVPGAAAIV